MNEYIIYNLQAILRDRAIEICLIKSEFSDRLQAKNPQKPPPPKKPESSSSLVLFFPSLSPYLNPFQLFCLFTYVRENQITAPISEMPVCFFYLFSSFRPKLPWSHRQPFILTKKSEAEEKRERERGGGGTSELCDKSRGHRFTKAK